MKKLTEERKILIKKFNSIFDNQQARLSYCFSLTFIQTYFLCFVKRKYIDKKGQVIKFLINNYLTREEKQKTNFDFIDFGKEYIKYFFNTKNIGTDESILKLFNVYYKSNIDNLYDFIQFIYDEKLDDNQVNIVSDFIFKKK